MTIKVAMIPSPTEDRGMSGIDTVVREWGRHLPQYGIEFTDYESADLVAVHAGMVRLRENSKPLVAILHGVYWTADYQAASWEWHANHSVIESARTAVKVTVPSNWVAETLRRDMRLEPTIVPHGIDWQKWGAVKTHGYVLGYAKNRVGDVCDPSFLPVLAKKFPHLTFYSTFEMDGMPDNIEVIGVVDHNKMKTIIQHAALVISPVKETFGILTLEAMASGVPVVGYDFGGNSELIRHGITGYLAHPQSIADLAEGIDYCLRHRKVLSANSLEVVKEYGWDHSCQLLSQVYTQALEIGSQKPTIGVVIPSYNYAHKVGRAIESALNQTVPISKIVVVDDGSPDGGRTQKVVEAFSDPRVIYLRQNNRGVAVARNNGIQHCDTKYIVCLDADDWIAPQFVEACLPSLEADHKLGIAYTGLMTVDSQGKQAQSEWPPAFEFDRMIPAEPKGINQIPTCCLFRREMWERLGGYRQRYAPHGAGSEDAEFWLRAGIYGWGAVKATDAHLFFYSYGTGQVSGDRNYQEVDWHYLHPETRDRQYPMACVARPTGMRPSHPVHQYDTPLISVVIPVSDRHKTLVFDALDSLESQTFRGWEAIVIDDSGTEDGWEVDGFQQALKAYPYVKLIRTPGKKGAGFARNRGAEAARGAFLLFLDSDDFFYSPDALLNFADAWKQGEAIVYSDYVGKAYLDADGVRRMRVENRLLSYDEKTGITLYRNHASDYNYDRAISQPEDPPYIWCLVTSLVPRKWHVEIGGFDENMPSWEDWLYWLTLARSGKNFVRIEEPLIGYRFYTGERREQGMMMAADLFRYMIDKLKGVKIMPCSNCGKSDTVHPTVRSVKTADQSIPQALKGVMDEDLVLIKYQSPQRGEHTVYGAVTGIFYGRRAGGGTVQFYVHRQDIAARPDLFIPVAIEIQSIEAQEPPPPPPVIGNIQPEEADKLDEGSAPKDETKAPKLAFDLQIIPGMTAQVSIQLEKEGIDSYSKIIALGEGGLMELDGIGKKRAQTILAYARRILEE